MKVLHLETGMHLYGGALQVLYLVEGLAARGIENVLVVPEGSAMEAEGGQRGLPVRPIPMAGEADLAFPFRFRKLLRKEGPDLVHLHSRRGADTLGALTTKLAGVPTVLSRRVDNPEAGWSLAAKYRLYDHVITISEAIRSVLVGQGVPEEKVTCVHSALDPAPFLGPCTRGDFEREFEIGANGKVVGMAAQFISRKGHLVLLKALPEIIREHPGTRFILFGQGPLLQKMKERVREDGLDSHVRFPGFRSDLPALLPCLDLLVHPAFMEGLGIILLQAAASALPIVATRAGGIPEAVADGETGLLVDSGSPEALAGAVRKLLREPSLAEAMGAAGRKRILSHFSPDSMVEGNLAVYRRLLSSRETASG